jgi:DNA-binding NarL/FixJ family response regulator
VFSKLIEMTDGEVAEWYKGEMAVREAALERIKQISEEKAELAERAAREKASAEEKAVKALFAAGQAPEEIAGAMGLEVSRVEGILK